MVVILSNRGSNALLWWPNHLSEKLREGVGDEGWSSWLDIGIIFPLWSWPVMTYQTHFSTPLSLWLQLRGFYAITPSYFSLVFFQNSSTLFECSACTLTQTHTGKIKITPIDIVKSALTLSVCLCQVEPSVQGLSRERVGAENPQPQQDKRTPPISSPHPLAHSFGLTPSSIMQDPRMQSIR